MGPAQEQFGNGETDRLYMTPLLLSRVMECFVFFFAKA